MLSHDKWRMRRLTASADTLTRRRATARSAFLFAFLLDLSLADICARHLAETRKKARERMQRYDYISPILSYELSTDTPGSLRATRALSEDAKQRAAEQRREVDADYREHCRKQYVV
jgi:uncharacterized lipoprotein YbaY